MKKVLPPESFATVEPPKKEERRKIKVHKGVKIINDTGEDNDWYVLHEGKLLKGTKEAIEIWIDRGLKIRQQ